MTDGLISVVVAVYNSEKYLRQCVDSILSQTYSKLQLILVDDGSTDESSLLCDQYAQKDKRVIVIHKENEGLSVARNVAIGIAEGEFISFIDSDDILYMRLFEIASRMMKENHLSILKYDYCINADELGTDENAECEIYDSNVVTSKILRDEYGSQLWQYLFKAELWKGIISPKGRLAQDMMTLHLVSSKVKSIGVTKSVLYYYYQDNAMNVSNSNKNGVRGTVDRSIAYWLRTDFCEKNMDYCGDFDFCLSKAVSYTVSCFCRKEFENDRKFNTDYKELRKRVSKNISKIFRSKSISFTRKFAVLTIAVAPKILSKVFSVKGQK